MPQNTSLTIIVIAFINLNTCCSDRMTKNKPDSKVKSEAVVYEARLLVQIM